MKKIYYNLDESDNYKLRHLLIEKFGKRFLDQDSTYIANENDIQIMIQCANEIIFNKKLPDKIPIIIVDRTDEMAKAVFMFSFFDQSYEPKIKYIREKDRDTMLFVANCIFHELIHYYDFLVGPLNSIKNNTISSNEVKKLFAEYDSHGDFFKKIMNIFIDNGIPVSIIQPDKVKVRYFMDSSELKENEEKPTLTQRAKMFYDSIKTDDLFLVEVKDDKVYVVMQ